MTTIFEPADALANRVFLWRLERADGVALGFTSHDRDLVVDNFPYRAAPGMRPSRLMLSDGFDPANVEMEGVLSDPAIAESDLIAGRWDGARLTVSRCDWTDPDTGVETLLTGEFGQTVREGDNFRVEILGATVRLRAAVAPATSPGCRAEFGDRLCKVSRHRYRQVMTLSAIADDMLSFDGISGDAANYRWGRIRWLSGANSGLSFDIVDCDGDGLIPAEPPAMPVAVGDRALLTQGCDKLFATCRDRFDNSDNFRGEPYLPGNDLLTRYPGGG